MMNRRDKYNIINVHNIRKNVHDIIISPIHHKIKAEKQLQWIY